MGNVPWDGIGRDRHKLLWDGNGTDKYVPWTTLAFSLIFVGNNSSPTDESVWAELRQLDTTGVDAAKNQLEVIEF